MSTLKDLLEYLKDLPDDTEILVREGDEAGPGWPIILENADGKMAVYMTTFLRGVTGDGLAPNTAQELRTILMKPYPKDLREVCPHGRNILGTCMTCDVREEGGMVFHVNHEEPK